jgi:hypothetical protein
VLVRDGDCSTASARLRSLTVVMLRENTVRGLGFSAARHTHPGPRFETG